jgi:hypothetical protein
LLTFSRSMFLYDESNNLIPCENEVFVFACKVWTLGLVYWNWRQTLFFLEEMACSREDSKWRIKSTCLEDKSYWKRRNQIKCCVYRMCSFFAVWQLQTMILFLFVRRSRRVLWNHLGLV